MFDSSEITTTQRSVYFKTCCSLLLYNSKPLSYTYYGDSMAVSIRGYYDARTTVVGAVGNVIYSFLSPWGEKVSPSVDINYLTMENANVIISIAYAHESFYLLDEMGVVWSWNVKENQNPTILSLSGGVALPVIIAMAGYSRDLFLVGEDGSLWHLESSWSGTKIANVTQTSYTDVIDVFCDKESSKMVILCKNGKLHYLRDRIHYGNEVELCSRSNVISVTFSGSKSYFLLDNGDLVCGNNSLVSLIAKDVHRIKGYDNYFVYLTFSGALFRYYPKNGEHEKLSVDCDVREYLLNTENSIVILDTDLNFSYLYGTNLVQLNPSQEFPRQPTRQKSAKK